MTVIEGFFDDLGFSESECSSFAWSDDILEVVFERGVDLGSPNHPLSKSFKFGDPCRLLFAGVVKSKLRVSSFVERPGDVEYHYFEKDSLPGRKDFVEYNDYYMEGAMGATSPSGWFVWDVLAEKFYFDDMKN